MCEQEEKVLTTSEINIFCCCLWLCCYAAVVDLELLLRRNARAGPAHSPPLSFEPNGRWGRSRRRDVCFWNCWWMDNIPYFGVGGTPNCNVSILKLTENKRPHGKHACSLAPQCQWFCTRECPDRCPSVGYAVSDNTVAVAIWGHSSVGSWWNTGIGIGKEYHNSLWVSPEPESRIIMSNDPTFNLGKKQTRQKRRQ